MSHTKTNNAILLIFVPQQDTYKIHVRECLLKIQDWYKKNLFKQGNGKKRVPLKHFESCNRKITFRQMLCQ
jgi:hypothetical protein